MEFICIYNRLLHYWKILASDLIRDLHLEFGLLATLSMQWSTEITHSVLLRSVILSAYFIWALALLDFIAWTTLHPTNTIHNSQLNTPWFPDSISHHSTLYPFRSICMHWYPHRLFLWLTWPLEDNSWSALGAWHRIRKAEWAANWSFLGSSSTRGLLQLRIIDRSSKQ